jgi:inorganic pyrophosphatase/exopolyphosphatase
MENLNKNINEYLSILKNVYMESEMDFINKKENKKFIFILGNSSCDLDSLISSLLLSLFRNLLANTDNFFANNLSTCKVLYLPIFNCNSDDFVDRLDINFLLKQYNIETENLIFIDNKKLKEDFQYLNYLNSIAENIKDESFIG